MARADRVVILDAKFGKVAAERRVEIDLVLLDQPHHRRAGERLADRTDLEQRVVGDGQRMVDVRDAEGANGDAPILEDADRDAGDGVLGHLRFHKVGNLLESRVDRRMRRRLREAGDE